MISYIRIKETCLYIQDLEKAVDFYQGLLKMELISKVENRHVFFRCGDTVLLCFIPESTEKESNLPPHFAKGKQHVAFEVAAENYKSTKQKLIHSGIKITHNQDWGNERESFYFEDPFGHVLEIVPTGIWE